MQVESIRPYRCECGKIMVQSKQGVGATLTCRNIHCVAYQISYHLPVIELVPVNPDITVKDPWDITDDK